MERERELHKERIELSQAIHDTAAQTAYLIGQGIRRAARLAGDSNEELAETLAATASLSKTAVWELRRPIDEGYLFEGRDLGRVLWSIRRVFALIRGQRGLTASRALDGMTDREKEILRMFVSGKSYAQIAEARGNKAVTVRNSIYRIQDKLGVDSKQEVVVWAVRHGLLDDPEAGG